MPASNECDGNAPVEHSHAEQEGVLSGGKQKTPFCHQYDAAAKPQGCGQYLQSMMFFHYEKFILLQIIVKPNQCLSSWG